MASPFLTLPKVQQCSLLVIGYSADSMGDGGVGKWVANAVAEWQLSSVRSIAVPQLTPELAIDLAQTDYAIFVDACGESCAPAVQLEPVVMGKAVLSLCTDLILPENCEPSALLALTQMIYHQHPQGWTIQIPTACLNPVDPMSDTARHGCDRALRTIEQFLRTYLSAPCANVLRESAASVKDTVPAL